MLRLGKSGVLAFVTALATIFAGVAAYALAIAPRWLEVVRLRVASPGLPEEWQGVRIAHLSDFHAGGAIPLDLLEIAKQIALDLEPDIVALTGDFYDIGRPFDAGDLYTNWGDRATVVAVLGNHDHRSTDDDLRFLLNELESAGVDVLTNRAKQVDLRGRRAWIVGVDDPFLLRSDPSAALEGVPVSEDVLLYLAHSPVAIESMPFGRARLMLSGHTHGGQVRIVPDGRIPFVRLARRLRGSPERPDPLVHRGVHWRRGAVLVISNGLGVSKVPLRFRTRPQVILIELARAEITGPACDSVERYVTQTDSGRAWLRWLS